MKLRITVQGQAYEVDVEVLEGASTPTISPAVSKPPAGPAAPLAPTPAPASAASAPARAAAPVADNGGPVGDRVVKAPIIGTIVSIKVNPGDEVSLNQVLLVMEAMKMETNVATPLAGKVKRILVQPGDAVKAGQTLVELE